MPSTGLKESTLPEDQTGGGRYTHSTFVEMGTNKPVYVHRKGSNVKYGKYYVDYNDQKLLVTLWRKNMYPDRSSEDRI